MAFPASQQTLKDALDGISSAAVRIKSLTQRLRDDSAAGATARNRYVALQRNLQIAIDTWDANASVPGLLAYARDQYDDGTLDLSAEYNAMKAAAQSLQTWIFNNLPTDSGTGAALLEVFDAQGNPTDLTVSSGGAAGFRTEADAFIATIG